LSSNKKNVSIIYHPDYLKHETGTHPERKERLLAIISHLKVTGLINKVKMIQPEAAEISHIQYVHTMDYIEKARHFSELEMSLDPDTILCKDSYDIALLAAGGAITAVDSVLSDSSSSFALIRPPGHHATPAHGMGFCIFNNIAIAARYAQKKEKKRILIIDWDAHHGNGTQEAFYNDPSVLYFSTHQYPHYPGTGWFDEVGSGDGEGYNINVPLPAGTNDGGFIGAFEEILLPAAHEFKPDLILVSAGQDTCRGDGLSGLKMTHEGFGVLTSIALSIAQEHGVKVALALEGGYNLHLLSHSVGQIIEVLLGNEPVRKDHVVDAKVRTRLEEIKNVMGKYWSFR